MGLRFGTDGVRGPATQLGDRFVAALGRAAAGALSRPGASSFLIGRDTRWSGPRIEGALARGLTLGGAAPLTAGMTTTPALAWLSAHLGVPAAMISASHNPADDNGIKLFAPGGRKLSDEVEGAVERELDRLLAEPPGDHAVPDLTVPVEGGVDVGLYEAAVGASLEGRRLDGIRVVADCANGASSDLAPRVLRELGASVTVLHADPDGHNINAGCGSTHPEGLQEAVLASGADAGLAFDGDADRVLAVDERGALVDGDHLMAMCAGDLQRRGRLADDTIVVTVMSNLGLRIAMAELGIEVVETSVGDRHVLEALESGNWSLGGEQSGHIIFAELATTGDGLLTGVQLLDLLQRSGSKLSELAGEAMTAVPQVLRNVVVARRPDGLPAELAEAVVEAQAELGDEGRVLVRPSGTEPLVRVMVEALDPAAADRTAERLVAIVERVCGSEA